MQTGIELSLASAIVGDTSPARQFLEPLFPPPSVSAAATSSVQVRDAFQRHLLPRLRSRFCTVAAEGFPVYLPPSAHHIPCTSGSGRRRVGTSPKPRARSVHVCGGHECGKLKAPGCPPRAWRLIPDSQSVKTAVKGGPEVTGAVKKCERSENVHMQKLDTAGTPSIALSVHRGQPIQD